MAEKKKKPSFDAEELLLSGVLKDEKLTDGERYRKGLDNIYRRLKPIWIQECKEALWLMKEEYVHIVAEILYLDNQMGGNLDPTSLSIEKQNLLGWKQVQTAIEKYKAQDYSLVDTEAIKAILSSIIKNKSARDADRLKAIEMYTEMYNGEQIEGITFLNDIPTKLKETREKKDDD